jgi:hypothetical protein
MSQRKIVDLNDFSKELGDFANASLASRRKAVISGIARSIPDLVAASPVDTGLYAASWDMTVMEQSVLLGNYAPYAGVIEYGARPHQMPIGPLLAWAKRVTGSSSQPPDYDSHVWALAKAVQAKIAREGQQPKHIMLNMIPAIIANIKEALQRGESI